MPCWTRQPWPHNLNQTVSGKAGAVQNGEIKLIINEVARSCYQLMREIDAVLTNVREDGVFRTQIRVAGYSSGTQMSEEATIQAWRDEIAHNQEKIVSRLAELPVFIEECVETANSFYVRLESLHARYSHYME